MRRPLQRKSPDSPVSLLRSVPVCLAFAQLTVRESLRDIEICLNSHREKLYHVGFRGPISRSTLGDANETWDYRILEDFGYHLISVAQKFYAGEERARELQQSLYILDSTTVDLCLSLFPWATFRSTKSAVKIHTLLNLKGSIPVFVNLTPGSVHDVKILDVLPIERESILAMDRGYTDFRRLYAILQTPAFSVTRAKRNLKYVRIFSRPVDKTTGLRADQTVILKTPASRTAFPESLRQVTFIDPDTGDRIVFLTNIFSVPAKTVEDIYEHRWQIELFFRWIKQHLNIKQFYGSSPNAVKIQIWTAIAVYLLVAIMKKRLLHPGNVHTILQILETNSFEKRSLFPVVNDAFKHKTKPRSSNQMNLFDS